MDLGALITWASKFDTSKLEQANNKRSRGVTYLGMIVDRGNAIMRNQKQTERYMGDIKEYVVQLEKIGISPQGATPTPPPTPAKTQEKPLTP